MKLENSIALAIVFLVVAALTYRVVDYYFDIKRWPGVRQALALFGFGDSRPVRDQFHRRELMKVLLAMDEASLDKLFGLYRERYGDGAYRYARKTHLEWRAGSVRPVTKTFERFLVDLPRVMSFDLKCEVLRRFMEEFTTRENVEMDVTTDDWDEKLTPVVNRLIERNYTIRLPAEVERRLRWLGDNDMQSAAVILSRAMADESRIAVSMLHEEFVGIENILSHERLRARVRHEIKLPCGTVTVNVRKG